MRKIAIALLAALPLTAALAAQPVAEHDVVEVRAAMVDTVNPATLAVWDVSNAAMDDSGGIDPALMDDAAWANLARAAGELQASATGLALAHALISARPDNLPDNEGQDGLPRMEDVQRFIDADPDTFREKALALASTAEALLKAAEARDSTTAGAMVEQMNLDCENCHSQFWYPPQV